MSFSGQTYGKNEVTSWPIPNYWDLLALFIIFSLILLMAWGTKQMVMGYQLGETIPIHLGAKYLPHYAIRTILRLFITLGCSIVATLIFGTLAAKNRHAERLIIPLVDILQSAPVLSFLTFAVVGFMWLFKGSLLGPECAAIFGIFTAQVWNMILNFYQELKTVPTELVEAAEMFHLSPWRRFWKIEVPYATPGLIWNMMISISGSWFFVIACEAFSIAGTNITLPGIGSYIFVANQQGNATAIFYAILTMLGLIIAYDQLLFRPLVYWTNNFQPEADEEESHSRPWLVSLFQHTKLLKLVSTYLTRWSNTLINLQYFNQPKRLGNNKLRRPWLVGCCYFLLYSFFGVMFTMLTFFVVKNVTFKEVYQVFGLGCITGLRVFILIFLASLIWVPIGVWIGLRPRWVRMVQPIIQFLAAFPANLFFPAVAYLIVTFNLSVEIWTSPLMILGTQWYILFNVIVGTSQIPLELRLAAKNFKLRGKLWWQRFILPGIAPYLVTGVITAAGGAWNASIVAEVIKWKDLSLHATGLGAYIQKNAEIGNSLKIALGTITMCIIVFLINRLFWKPLYDYVTERFRY